MIEKAIIAAVGENGAIGRTGDLVWHIREDLKYFKAVTMGHPVIMGRRTWESIGRALPGRLNIVVSRTMGPADVPEGVVVTFSLESAFKIAEAAGADRCFVMGGGQLYRQSIDSADLLFITEIHAAADDADTFFPAIDPDIWQAESAADTAVDEKSGIEYRFVVYRRR